MKFFLKKVNKQNSGFTLVEMLVAVSIFTVSLLGIMSVIASGISDTGYAKKKIIATYLAQEGIEYIRNMRDTYVLYPANGGWGDEETDGSLLEKLKRCKGKNGNGNGNNNTGCGVDSSDNVEQGGFIFKCVENNNDNKCDLYLYNGSYNAYPGNVPSGALDSGFDRKIWM